MSISPGQPVSNNSLSFHDYFIFRTGAVQHLPPIVRAGDPVRIIQEIMVMKHLSAPALAGLFVVAIAASGFARADDVHCPPNLGAVTIDGNVLIAAPCRLDGTRVIGNVHMYAGGSLIARNARIDGSIQADNSDFVDVQESRVNGNIQLENLVGDETHIFSNEVGGSIQLKHNRSRLVVDDNEVIADVQAFDNTGGVVITANVIDGNLQCKSNSPPPAGGGNRVQGNKEDQCRNLQPEGAGSGGGAGPVVPPVAAVSSGNSGGGGSLNPLALAGLVLLGSVAALRRRSTKSGKVD